MKKVLLLFTLLILVIMGCETPGDKFPQFNLKETILGKIRNHEIKKICFINENKGFAAISYDTIIRTTDSCKTFSISLIGRSAQFQGIQFANENTGFIIDRKNNIYRTVDGGTTWEITRVNLPEANLLDIFCLNRDTVFIAAGGNPKSFTGYIIRSVNGGSTWDTMRTINISSVYFYDKINGFACGKDGIIKSTDCGQTWEQISTVSADEIVFFDENIGYCSSKRSLYRSIDGGRNWKLVRTIINPHWIVGEDFSRIECLNIINEKDLVFTLNSRLIKVSSDQKWFQYEFTRPYYQLQMIGKNKGIVYGFENLILVEF